MQHFLNIDNNTKRFFSSKQHIRMISEGSCDTEDRSNDAENCYHRNKLHFKIFHNITDFTVFDQINLALGPDLLNRAN